MGTNKDGILRWVVCGLHLLEFVLPTKLANKTSCKCPPTWHDPIIIETRSRGLGVSTVNSTFPEYLCKPYITPYSGGEGSLYMKRVSS